MLNYFYCSLTQFSLHSQKNNFTILVHNYSILNLLIIFNRELNPVIVYQTHIDDSIPDEHTPHY